MKKRELMHRLRSIAGSHGTTIELARRGKHEIYRCRGFTFPVPRHNEIAEGTARSIIAALTDHLEKR